MIQIGLIFLNPYYQTLGGLGCGARVFFHKFLKNVPEINALATWDLLVWAKHRTSLW